MRSPTEEQMKYIMSLFPQAVEDNTEFLLRFWEEACRYRNIDFPEAVKQVIREYKPESVVRKRRAMVEGTDRQKQEEQEYRLAYGV